MKVKFWGVRGSIAVSGPEVSRVGGNTSCVSVEHEGHRLVFDGGTGLRAMGQEDPGAFTSTTILFSHVHWDHIQGVPFFAPAYNPNHEVRFCGRSWAELHDALEQQMRPPTFPVALDQLAATKNFVEIAPGSHKSFGPFMVFAGALDHPQGSIAYRVEAGGRSVVFATDHEASQGGCEALMSLSQGVDLLIHDAQYTDDEIAGRMGIAKRGWGHSSWQEATDAAMRADVGLLALFHHDPTRSDDDVAILEAEARRRFPATLAARERRVVTL